MLVKPKPYKLKWTAPDPMELSFYRKWEIFGILAKGAAKANAFVVFLTEPEIKWIIEEVDNKYIAQINTNSTYSSTRPGTVWRCVIGKDRAAVNSFRAQCGLYE